MPSTLYEALGVARTASSEQIQEAYRNLAKQVHPDAGGNAALFRLVREAYETLIDPAARAVYDDTLAPSKTAGGRNALRPPGPGECDVCGAHWARQMHLRRHTGMLIMWRVHHLEGQFCQQCGLALFRDYMNWTLMAGWWGVIAFYANLYAIVANWLALRQLSQVPLVGRHAVVQAPFAHSLPSGRPLIARSGIWVGGVGILAMAWLAQ